MATVLPKDPLSRSQIEMAHGAGGKASRRLVEGLFAPLLFGSTSNPWAMPLIWTSTGREIAITTDSFVVKPLRFPAAPSVNWPSTER
jgi:hydrogenase expression/formation protein HypE